jgi:hypothetical protein
VSIRLPEEYGVRIRLPGGAVQGPGARVPDRDNVISLYPIIVASQGESPNESSYQIQNPLITCRITRKHATL